MSTFDPNRPRKRMRRISEKRQLQIDAERVVKAKVAHRDGGRCAGSWLWPEIRCDFEYGLDKHEIVTRARGGDPLDPDNCVLLCRAHHDAVHDNPAEATARGLLRSQHEGEHE